MHARTRSSMPVLDYSMLSQSSTSIVILSNRLVSQLWPMKNLKPSSYIIRVCGMQRFEMMEEPPELPPPLMISSIIEPPELPPPLMRSSRMSSMLRSPLMRSSKSIVELLELLPPPLTTIVELLELPPPLMKSSKIELLLELPPLMVVVVELELPLELMKSSKSAHELPE